MTDSDDLMDAFPGFSTQCHKKIILSKKKKKKKEGEIFLGDYHTLSCTKGMSFLVEYFVRKFGFYL